MQPLLTVLLQFIKTRLCFLPSLPGLEQPAVLNALRLAKL